MRLPAEFIYGLGLAFAIEALTIMLRFGRGIRAAEATARLARFTGGRRIHHGYVGLVFLIAAAFCPQGLWKQVCMVLGLGLVISDLVHHIVVLRLATGRSEFDLKYPADESPPENKTGGTV